MELLVLEGDVVSPCVFRESQRNTNSGGEGR